MWLLPESGMLLQPMHLTYLGACCVSQREHEGRMSIASSLYWAIFAWNYQATLEATLPLQPSEDIWARLLVRPWVLGSHERPAQRSQLAFSERLLS